MKRCALALLIFIAGCTPLSQPVWPVEKSHAKLAKNVYITADGTRLPMKSWLPEKKPEAVILALHGFNDYSNAFASPGRYLKQRGVAVYAYDQRGFGASPMTGIWAGEENLVNDAKQALILLKRRYPRTPVYLMGESMGGAVALLAMGDANDLKINGLILVAPAVWGGGAMNPMMRSSLWVWAHLVPGQKLTGEDLEIRASDNNAMLRAMWHDPLVIKETRVDAVYGLVNLMGAAYARSDQVKTRTLLLHGDRDEVIPRAPIMEIAAAYSVAAQISYYPNGYHMLLRDLQGKKVTEDILRWLNRSNGL